MSNPSLTALEELAIWCAEAPDQHSDLAYARAKVAFSDTVACMVLGSNHRATAAVREAVAPWGVGACTVVGGCEKLSPPWAALVNGTAALAHDLDDHELAGITHPSAAMVPALLALAEDRACSGRQLLDAYVVGLEVIMRIGEGVNMHFYHRGWHAASTIGALGAAAACARLLSLDAEAHTAAIGIGTSLAAGCNSQVGSTTKPMHAGLAAKAGVLASGLAEAGVDSSLGVLDAKWSSFLSLYAGPDAKGFSEPISKLGKVLAIDEYGIVQKIYPCCGFLHRAVDAILELRKEHSFSCDSVRKIVVTIPGRNRDILVFPQPQTDAEARYSMQYCMAVALRTGQLSIADFEPAALRRPEVVSILSRVDLRGHPVTAASMDPATQEPDVVEVLLDDGRTLSKSVQHARGTPARPLSEQERAAKFDSCTSALTPRNRASLWSMLEHLDELVDVGEVTDCLATN